MRFPAELKYTKDHEWAKAEGNSIVVGITDHAQSALGDIVYVDLPTAGRDLKPGETFGVVESIKAVSDLYAPIAGKVVESNSPLKDDPSKINQEPYTCWLIKVQPTDPNALSQLMDAETYTKFVQNLK